MEIVVTVIPTAYALLEVTKNAIHDEARGPYPVLARYGWDSGLMALSTTSDPGSWAL